MRLLFLNNQRSLLWLFSLLMIPGTIQSQEVLSFQKGESLVSVIQEIQDHSDVYFSFVHEQLEGKTLKNRVSSSDHQFFESIFYPHELEFKEMGDQIIVYKSQKIYRNLCLNIKGNNLAWNPINIWLTMANLEMSTDREGQWRYSTLFDPDEEVIVYQFGYKTDTLNITEFTNDSCMALQLIPLNFQMEEILVQEYISSNVQISDGGLKTRLNQAAIGNVPGNLDKDPVRAINLLPGINIANGKVSNINIRGATADQSLILWEGIPLYHIGHYFGTISALNGEYIDVVNVFRNGFGPEYGERIGGIVSLETEKKKNFVQFNQSLSHSGVTGSVAGWKDAIRFSFSGRSSYDQIWRTPLIDNLTQLNQQAFLLSNKTIGKLPDHISLNNAFDFYDISAHGEVKLSSKDELSVGFMTGHNSFEGIILDEKTKQDQRDTLDLNYRGLSVQYNRKWSADQQSEVRWTQSLNRFSYQYFLSEEEISNVIQEGLKYNQIEENKISFIQSGRINRNMQWKGGLQYILYRTEYDIEEWDEDSGLFNEENDLDRSVFATFLEWEQKIVPGLRSRIGWRSSYYSGLQKWFQQPRVSLNYAPNDYWNISGYYGRSNQFIGLISTFKGNARGISTPIWSMTDSKSIPIQIGDLYDIGFLFKKSHWTIDIHAYTRLTKGVSSRAYNFEFIEGNVALEGDSRVNGCDFLLSYDRNGLTSFLTYSLSEAMWNFPEIQSSAVPTSFDQRHILMWTQKWRKHNWTAAYALHYQSGLTFTRMTRFEPNRDPDTPGRFRTFWEDINASRLPGQLDLSLSLGYRKNLGKKYEGECVISAMNLLNRDNAYARTYFVNNPVGQSAEIDYTEYFNLPFTYNITFSIKRKIVR